MFVDGLRFRVGAWLEINGRHHPIADQFWPWLVCLSILLAAFTDCVEVGGAQLKDLEIGTRCTGQYL